MSSSRNRQGDSANGKRHRLHKATKDDNFDDDSYSSPSSRLYVISKLMESRTLPKAPVVFELPDSQIDLKGNSETALRKRLHQCAYLLVLYKKQEGEQLYAKTVSMLKELDTHHKISVDVLESLEQQIEIMLSGKPIVCTKDAMRGDLYNKTRLELDLTIKVKHKIKQSSNAEQINPHIFVYFSKHVTPEPRFQHAQRISANDGDVHQIRLNLSMFEFVDGAYAVLRFSHFAEFVPDAGQSRQLPYKRKRPFYAGYIHLSELEKNSMFRVYLRDSCLVTKTTPFSRQDDVHIELEITVNDISPINFTRKYSDDERDKQVDTITSLTKRYYSFFDSEEPVTDQMRSMHVPRMPCDMNDILLPAALFLMDLPENRPPHVLFDYALDIHDMTKEEFVSACKRQFSDVHGTKIHQDFHRACIVAWRTISLVSHMSDYTADIRYLETQKKTEDVERFVDIFYTLAADCEDLAKAIIIQFISWLESPEHNDNNTDSAIHFLVSIFKLFACTSMNGSAYSKSAVTSPSMEREIDPEHLICHFWAVATPWVIFSKWTGIKYTPKYAWEESGLFTWILEGTNDCHPCPRPLYTLCDNEQDRQKAQGELSALGRRRVELGRHYQEIAKLGISGYSTIDPENAATSDFYHYGSEIWAPYYMFQHGLPVSTFELYDGDTSQGYGIPIRTFAYHPERIKLKTTFQFSPEELEICMQTIKQQWPVTFPHQLDEHVKIAHDRDTLYSLERIAEDYPAVDAQQQIKAGTGFYPPYLRYFVRDPSMITPRLCAVLRAILKERYLGIYGMECRSYAVSLGIDHKKLAQLIDIRLYFK